MNSNWPDVRFGDVLGEPLRSGLYKPTQFHGEGVQIINMGELFAYPRLGMVEMRRLRVTDEELERFRIIPGDLLFARRSLVAEGAGRCALVTEVAEPTVFESSLIRARPSPTITLSGFLYYFFSSPVGRTRLHSILRQVAVSGITGSDLAQLSVPLPTIDEQRRIVGVLGALDDKIDALNAENAVLSEIARLGHRTWTAQIQTYRPLTDFAQVVSGGTPRTSVGDFWGGPIQWFSVVDTPRREDVFVLSTERTITQVGLSSCAATLLPEFATILTARGTVGNLAMAGVTMATNQSCYGLIAQGGAGPAFLYHATLEAVDELRHRSHGSVFSTITRDTLRAINVASPPQASLDAFEESVMPLLLAIRSNLKLAGTLRAIRDALLPMLVSGAIPVPDSYDPDDAVGSVAAAVGLTVP